MSDAASASRRPGRLVAPRGEAGLPVPGAGSLGMGLFLLSLAILFAGSMVAVLYVRLRAGAGWGAQDVDLPPLLWVSTALLAAVSVTIQKGLADIRRGDSRRLRRGLVAAGVLAAGFLVSQSASWIDLWGASVLDGPSLWGFSFYVLTFLHALHVAGGLVALAVVTTRAWRGAYSWAYYPGVRHCAVYWHFLGAVWVVIFALLQL